MSLDIRKTHNIYLIGMPGAGKTTLGRQLAECLELPFLDLDTRITEAIGCSISDYFATQGEAAFRDVEQQALHDTGKTGGQVIATGGGIVLRPDNVARMRETGQVFWIRRSIDAILSDIQTAHRPLLANQPPAERLQALADTRYALYEGCAHHIIANDGTPEEALSLMVARLSGI